MRGLKITQENLDEPAGRRQERGEGQRPQPAVRRIPVARPAADRQHELVQRPQLLRRPRRTSTRRRSRTSQQFFKTYYAPNNAVLVVTGDIDVRADARLGQEVLRRDPRSQAAAASPTSPSRGRRRKSGRPRTMRSPTVRRWRSATTSRRANTPEYYAMGLIDQILVQGQDSRALPGARAAARADRRRSRAAPTRPRQHVRHQGADAVDGLAHPRRRQDRRRDREGDRRRDRAPAEHAGDEGGARPRAGEAALAALRRAGAVLRFGRADLLASFALFDDDPGKIKRLEDEFRKVTPELIQKTAREYLRPTNRTILTITPKSK